VTVQNPTAQSTNGHKPVPADDGFTPAGQAIISAAEAAAQLHAMLQKLIDDPAATSQFFPDAPGSLPRPVKAGTFLTVDACGETLIINGGFEHLVRIDGLTAGPSRDMSGFWEEFVEALYDELIDPALAILNRAPSPLTGLIQGMLNQRLASLDPGPWRVAITQNANHGRQ
jgi:hypothetical protein